MGSANWFYIDGSGCTVGPESSDTMKDLSRGKVIKPNTLVKQGKASEWQRSVDCEEFRIQIVLGRKRPPSTDREESRVLKGSVPIAELITRWDEAKAEKMPKPPMDTEPSSNRQQTTPVSSDGESRKRCPMCSEWILSSAKKCRYCHSSLVEGKSSNRTAKPEASSTNRRVACCSRCGSDQLATSNVGFGIGKAVLGTLAFGPLGLIGGAVGANKVKITCLECGFEMSPGK
jgi:hypothetical protein